MTASRYARPPGLLPAGTPAPDFALSPPPTRLLSSASSAGRPVILAFYPADWSPSGSDQMALTTRYSPSLRARRPSCSGSRSMAPGVTRHSRRTEAPLPAPRRLRGRRATSRACTVPIATGTATASARSSSSTATAIIRWSYCSPVGVNPGADGILSALDRSRVNRVPAEAQS